jgi:hypothetical protein
VTEDLEESLREGFEGYLEERQRKVNEELSLLKEEFDNAFARLRESFRGESLAETSLAASITEHLRAAYQQGADDANDSSQSAASGETEIIKCAVAEIAAQQTQANVLDALLRHAAHFAQRVALFVIRSEQVIGWRARGTDAAIADEEVRSIVLPLTKDTLLSYAARSRSSWSGAPGSNAEDDLLLGKLGGEPQSISAVPLIVRGKAVAVLYADSSSPAPGAVNVEAIETLARVAEMAVDLVSLGRLTSRDVHPTETALAPTPVAAAPPQPTEVAAAEAIAPAVVEAEPAISEFERETAPVELEAELEPPVEQTYLIAEQAQPVAEQTQTVVEQAQTVVEQAQTVVEHTTPVVEQVEAPEEAPPVVNEIATPTIEPPATLVEAPEAMEPEIPFTAPAMPSFAGDYSTPLGSARRYGVAEPELPIEVGEEERRWHNDARRFARLLVSEIKLYNEPKVKDGRANGDIYDRLREDIDRSRQMYDKRVAPPVAARFDYFHQELVKTLADGDSSRLGESYPGTSAPVA